MILLTNDPLRQVIVVFLMAGPDEDFADEDWEGVGFVVSAGSGVTVTFGTGVTTGIGVAIALVCESFTFKVGFE